MEPPANFGFVDLIEVYRAQDLAVPLRQCRKYPPDLPLQVGVDQGAIQVYRWIGRLFRTFSPRLFAPVDAAKLPHHVVAHAVDERPKTLRTVNPFPSPQRDQDTREGLLPDVLDQLAGPQAHAQLQK